MTLEYQQLQPPEGINTSTEHPLKEFAVLLSGVALFVIAAVVLFSLTAHLLAPYVPFSLEQRLAKVFIEEQKEGAAVTGHAELTAYLQSLADRVATAQGMPAEMPVAVHYVDSDTVNAFATLGGHLYFFRGLLEQLPDENTLAMVMAHEVAHIRYRHPIKALGRGVILGAAIAVVSLSVGSDVVGNVMGEAGLVTALTFSREHEAQADAGALASIAQLYGHLGGSTTLFELLQASHKDSAPEIEFFSSHPLTENRVEHIATVAKSNGWQITGALTPLPENFKAWLNSEAADCNDNHR
jgi:predicted Zn-dependent protease